jgi:hypothetical protein
LPTVAITLDEPSLPLLRPRVEAVAGPAFGQDVLGSEDTRRGGFYGVTYSRHEPRFRFRGTEAAVVYGAYYMFTKGGGFEDIPVNKMHSFGATVGARYPLPWISGGRLFADLGWGLAYNSIRTRDLDSRLNSTPYVGVGYAFEQGTLTLRWFHMSNGGSNGNNQGLNQAVVLFGMRI